MKTCFAILFSILLVFQARAQIKMALPLNSLHITSGFGFRIHPVTGIRDFHRGVDLRAKSEPVFAILPGRVIACGYQPILGNYVKMQHGDLVSIYGHLSLVLVEASLKIPAGFLIGISGESGRTTGAHLHFAISLGGVYINPIRFLYALESNNHW
ncbi:M23 family metallopeptidase [Pedobacter aquatilis]|uniref:M23 family metallopeptidase n=1 Tax=Pedobacter aquatilis TaxID=351343 RepID=UPI00292D505C|nr:M23 family metallopeptidase [Pedobacter aquatilis]